MTKGYDLFMFIREDGLSRSYFKQILLPPGKLKEAQFLPSD